MPTSRPGYIWSGTEWIPIGSQPNITPVKIQSSEPTSPQTGDVWVDTSEISPSIDPTTLATKDELSLVEAIAMLGL
jgi:hypothetical protein